MGCYFLDTQYKGALPLHHEPVRLLQGCGSRCTLPEPTFEKKPGNYPDPTLDKKSYHGFNDKRAKSEYLFSSQTVQFV